MKYALILGFILLVGCAALPLFIKDAQEVVEVEEAITETISKDKISLRRSKIHAYSQAIYCVIEPWKCEDYDESEEDSETFMDRMQNYSDYFQYHFGPDIA